MRLRLVSSAIMALGALLLMFGFGALLPDVALAQQEPVLQPSPRPAVQFSGQAGGDASSGQATVPGHITGTVIDSISGAPVPGMPVKVGDLLLFSDQNGNYDTWLAAGTYIVNVAPAPEQGTVVDEARIVDVQPDTVTIQHLRVALPAPIIVAPAAEEQPVAAAPEAAPRRLPRTNDTADAAWLWIALGAVMVVLGLAMGVWPAGRRMLASGARASGMAQLSDSALLRSLLRERPSARVEQDDELLRKLLER